MVNNVERAIALDRLRKRLQSYRRHHDTSGPKYERTSSTIYDQQRQDTVSYHQKVVDSRLKKQAKGTTPKNSNSGGGSAVFPQSSNNATNKDIDTRAVQIANFLKRKLDAEQQGGLGPGNNGYNNSESAPTGDKGSTFGGFPSENHSGPGLGQPTGPNSKRPCPGPTPSNIGPNVGDNSSNIPHQSVQVKVVQKFDSESNSGGTVTTQVTVSSNAPHGGPNTTNVETNVDIKHEKPDGFDSHRMPEKPDANPLHQTSKKHGNTTQGNSGTNANNNTNNANFSDNSHDTNTLDDHDIKDILQLLEDDDMHDPSGELPPDIMMAIEQIEEESGTGATNSDLKNNSTSGMWNSTAPVTEHPPFLNTGSTTSSAGHYPGPTGFSSSNQSNTDGPKSNQPKPPPPYGANIGSASHPSMASTASSNASSAFQATVSMETSTTVTASGPATVTVGNTTNMDINLKANPVPSSQSGTNTPCGQPPGSNASGVPPCASPVATAPPSASTQPGSGPPAISPAAATLKQMADKHNSQREQLQQQHSQGSSPASAGQGPQGQPGTPQGHSAYQNCSPGGPLSPFSPSSLRYPSPFSQSNGPQGSGNATSSNPVGYPVNRTSPFPGGASSNPTSSNAPNGPIPGSNPAFFAGNVPSNTGMSNMYQAGNPSMTSPSPHQNVGNHSSPIGGQNFSSSSASVTVKQEVISSPGTPGSIGSPVPTAPNITPTGHPNNYPRGVSPGHPYGGPMQNSTTLTRPPGPPNPNTSSSLAQLQQMQMRHNPQASNFGPTSSTHGVNVNHPGQSMGGPNPGIHPGMRPGLYPNQVGPGGSYHPGPHGNYPSIHHHHSHPSHMMGPQSPHMSAQMISSSHQSVEFHQCQPGMMPHHHHMHMQGQQSQQMMAQVGPNGSNSSMCPSSGYSGTMSMSSMQSMNTSLSVNRNGMTPAQMCQNVPNTSHQMTPEMQQMMMMQQHQRQMQMQHMQAQQNSMGHHGPQPGQGTPNHFSIMAAGQQGYPQQQQLPPGGPHAPPGFGPTGHGPRIPHNPNVGPAPGPPTGPHGMYRGPSPSQPAMIKQELGTLPSPATSSAPTSQTSNNTSENPPSSQTGRVTPSASQCKAPTSASPIPTHNPSLTTRAGGNIATTTTTTTTTKSQAKSNTLTGSQRQSKTQQSPHSIRQSTCTANSSTDTAPPTTHYTSAIMRNQRPPNVNVGPDGLNISQPMLMPGNGPQNGVQPGQPWYRPSSGGPTGGPGNQMYLRQNSAPVNPSQMMNAGGPGSPMNPQANFTSQPQTMNPHMGGPQPSRQMSMGSPGPNMMVPVGSNPMGIRGPHTSSAQQYFSQNSHPHGSNMPQMMQATQSQIPHHAQMQTQVQQQLTMQSNQQQMSINCSQQSSMQMHVSSSVTMAAQQAQSDVSHNIPNQQTSNTVGNSATNISNQNANFGNNTSNTDDFSLDFLDNPFPETSNDLFDPDFSLLEDLVP